MFSLSVDVGKMKFHNCWPPGKNPFDHCRKIHYFPRPGKNPADD